MNTPQECAFRIVGGYCMATTVKNCKCVCKFAQTHEERGKRIKKSNKRINSLPFQQQVNISEKYYDGATPWKLI